MQSSSRAPVLSATLSRDSCWIIWPAPGSPRGASAWSPTAAGSRRSGRRRRACLVPLVVGVELDAAADDLLVPGVRGDHVHLDHDRLVHGVGDDDAAPLLPAASLARRLRLAHDRLAPAGRRRPAGPRLLRAESPGEALALAP